MTYIVYYKKGMFWHKLRNVKGDGIVEHNKSRFFILDDETRIEIPIDYIFKFSKERFLLIKQRMEEESGQSLKLKGNF